MWPFIDNLIKDLSIYAAEDFVIEGDILLPKYLKKYKESSGVKVCYIGFPTVFISQKMKDILQSRKEGDWTKEYREKNNLSIMLTDQEKKYLSRICDRIISMSFK
jgi:hypothetical protein